MIRNVFDCLAATAAIAAAFPIAASAGTVSGQQLLALCTANMWGKGHPLEAAECMGFVVGVSDTLNCVQGDYGFRWNSSSDVSEPKRVALVVQWLQRHPEALQFEGHRVVGAALQEAFPCK